MKSRFARVQLAVVGLFLASVALGGEPVGNQQADKEPAIATGTSVGKSPFLLSTDVWAATPTGIGGVWSVSAIRAAELIPAVFFWSDGVQPYGQRRDLTRSGSVHEVSVVQGALQRSDGTHQLIVAVLITSLSTAETKLVKLQAFEEPTAAKAYFLNFQRNPITPVTTDPNNSRWSCIDCRNACDRLREEELDQCFSDWLVNHAILLAAEAACLGACKGNLGCMAICFGLYLAGTREADQVLNDCQRLARLEWFVCVDGCGEIAY